jgi:hypothetical protein
MGAPQGERLTAKIDLSQPPMTEVGLVWVVEVAPEAAAHPILDEALSRRYLLVSSRRSCSLTPAGSSSLERG